MVLADSFYYQPVQIDTINTRVNADLFAKEGDANGRGMVVQITENGIIKDTTGITLRLQWSHVSVAVSGFTDFEVVDATKGLYKVKYPTSMLHRGRVEAFIRITDNGILSGTRNLSITVERMVGSDGTIEAADDFSALQTALIQLDAWNVTIGGKVDTWEADMEATKQLYIDTLAGAETAYSQELVSLKGELAENTSQMLKSYGLLFDGTDTLATLQSALTDIASKYSSVKFPHKAIFNITNTLYIPAGLTIDFNGAVFTSTNDIDFDSIVIGGSNVHVTNLKIIEAGHAYLSDADGLVISGAANIENVTIENVTTEGFENGIAVKTDTGFLASNINILNCNTSYGASAGLSVRNARNVAITNHNATHNALDGLKISQNTNYIKVSGGYFGYNVNPIDGYADGIDLYAGSPYIIVDGAVCDYNGGVGIHMLSGELNDPLYVGYVGNAEKNIIIVNCITRNNVSSGIDVLSKVTVSATTPHPSKILISNSISEGNEYGIIMKARHVTVSGCITTGNKKYGIQAAQSRYIILADNHVIANSKLSAGAYPGISISASAYVQVDKGVINGADSDSLQDGNESALTIWHVHGIEISGADTCDNIFIDNPIITNYTGFRQVNVSNVAANPNKKIIIKLGDIGNDTTAGYYGYYGSSFYKNNRLYEKNTDLSSTVWGVKPIEKSGIKSFTASAGQISFSIPHGLGGAPTKFYAILRTQPEDKFITYVTVDETYLYVKVNLGVSAGITFSIHWVASY